MTLGQARTGQCLWRRPLCLARHMRRALLHVVHGRLSVVVVEDKEQRARRLTARDHDDSGNINAC